MRDDVGARARSASSKWRPSLNRCRSSSPSSGPKAIGILGLLHRVGPCDAQQIGRRVGHGRLRTGPACIARSSVASDARSPRRSTSTACAPGRKTRTTRPAGAVMRPEHARRDRRWRAVRRAPRRRRGRAAECWSCRSRLALRAVCREGARRCAQGRAAGRRARSAGWPPRSPPRRPPSRSGRNRAARRPLHGRPPLGGLAIAPRKAFSAPCRAAASSAAGAVPATRRLATTFFGSSAVAAA